MYRRTPSRRIARPGTRFLRFESLECRRLLASDWCNDFNAFDVTDDGFVTPVDALAAITDLNAAGIRLLPPAENPPYFVDVNDDGVASAVDLLTLVDELNRGQYRQVVALGEADQLMHELVRAVTLQEHQGRHTIRFDVTVDFDTADGGSLCEDVLLVSLVDPMDSGQTLLDRGENGTTLFSLMGDKAEYPPSFVFYDGQTVEIDVSSLEIPTGGHLLVQLINHDNDTGSRILINRFVDSVDPQGTPSDVLPWLPETVPPGETMDVSAMTPAEDILVELENIHLDHTHTQYTADMRVVNQGAATGRDLAVVFADLPEGVSLLNASGTDPMGNPLVNLHEAIPSGGLVSGGTSSAVTITFEIPDSTRFPLMPQVYTAGPNNAPVLDPVGPLAVVPGTPLEVAVSATDSDGDDITFSVRPIGPLPEVAVRDNQTLVISASPAELGSYQFELVADDGAAQAIQAVSLDVVPDTVGTTRVSGLVVDTNALPVANLPVQVGAFQATTAADGTFTLEFPPGKVPTAAMNIAIPQGDAHFDPQATGTQTIPFRRAISDPATGDSPANPLQHPNLISSFIDGSAVYGSDEHRAAALRTQDGSGRLKTSPGDLLPQNSSVYFPDGPLENENAGPFDPSSLFVAGDVRASENPALVSLHTLLVREHNRKADELAASNPGWTGDQIYETARRWVGALMQHITYAEYLPMLLGEGAIGAYTQYDASVDPGMSGLFSTAAYRLGHSIVAPEFPLLNEDGSSLPEGPLPLRDAFFNPLPILDEGIEPVLRGLAVQPAQELDAKVIDDLRNFLFGPPGGGGMDLVSMNMQRGRDLGLPSYNQARIDMGLPPADDFTDITSDPALQAALQSVYDEVDQVDVWAGGLAEDHLPGAMLGELFWTVVRDQFQRFRDGDRFWYENSQFTDAELAEIRGTTLADLILRNTSIVAIDPSVFSSGPVPAPPPAGGSSAAVAPEEYRSFDGSGNNPLDASLGRAGTNLVVNYTREYTDGASHPAGADRPPVREISNAIFAQTESIPSTEHATYMLVMWGQFIDHDIGLTPGGVTDVMNLLGSSVNSGDSYGDAQVVLPALLGHSVYAGYNNVLPTPLVLPPSDGN